MLVEFLRRDKTAHTEYYHVFIARVLHSLDLLQLAADRFLVPLVRRLRARALMLGLVLDDAAVVEHLRRIKDDEDYPLVVQLLLLIVGGRLELALQEEPRVEALSQKRLGCAQLRNLASLLRVELGLIDHTDLGGLLLAVLEVGCVEQDLLSAFY